MYMDLMLSGADMGAGYPSSPVSLSVEWAPGLTPVKVGDTTHVTISVAAQGPGLPANLFAPGFGVMFWVASGAATLMGGEGTIVGQPAGNRYDISMEAADGALANIIVRPDAAGTIVIDALIPACGEEPPKGRWCSQVDLAVPVEIIAE